MADLPRQAYPRIAAINQEFGPLNPGFVDAAIVALAETLNVPRIATSDRRHFTALALRFGLQLLP